MNESTLVASSRTLSSGVSSDPIAPGVGTGNILEIAVIIVSTRRKRIEIAGTCPGRRPFFFVIRCNCKTDLSIHFKPSVLLKITNMSNLYCIKVNIGRRHRKVGRKHYLPMVYSLFVRCFTGAS